MVFDSKYSMFNAEEFEALKAPEVFLSESKAIS
jgi:hypothetical protein